MARPPVAFLREVMEWDPVVVSRIAPALGFAQGRRFGNTRLALILVAISVDADAVVGSGLPVEIGDILACNGYGDSDNIVYAYRIVAAMPVAFDGAFVMDCVARHAPIAEPVVIEAMVQAMLAMDRIPRDAAASVWRRAVVLGDPRSDLAAIALSRAVGMDGVWPRALLERNSTIVRAALMDVLGPSEAVAVAAGDLLVGGCAAERLAAARYLVRTGLIAHARQDVAAQAYDVLVEMDALDPHGDV
jgi:hypothetical protein